MRLGWPLDRKQRLIKATLDSVTNIHQLLGGAKLLRTKDGGENSSQGWSNIFVNPDLTKEERERSRSLLIELGKKIRWRELEFGYLSWQNNRQKKHL